MKKTTLLLSLKCFSSLPFSKVRLIGKGNRLAAYAHCVMEGKQAHHVTTALGTDCNTKLQKQHNPFKIQAGVHGQRLPSDSCIFSHSKDIFCFFILNGLGLLKKDFFIKRRHYCRILHTLRLNRFQCTVFSAIIVAQSLMFTLTRHLHVTSCLLQANWAVLKWDLSSCSLMFEDFTQRSESVKQTFASI